MDGSVLLQYRGETFIDTYTHAHALTNTHTHSPTVNSTLRNLSNVYREQGQLDKAEELERLTQQKVPIPEYAAALHTYTHTYTYVHTVHTHVLVIVRKSSCTRYNGTRGGVEIVIQYEAQPSTVWSIETRHECHYIQYSLISVL